MGFKATCDIRVTTHGSMHGDKAFWEDKWSEKCRVVLGSLACIKPKHLAVC